MRKRVEEAIILAAGNGSRLRGITGRMPKFMLRVGDLPLIVYTILLYRRYGITNIHIVTQKRWVPFIAAALRKYEIRGKIEIILNNEVAKENGYSFLVCKNHVNRERFLLSMSDHIFAPHFLRDFLRRAVHLNADIVIAGNANPRYINHEEATKIQADSNGHVLAIGKDLRNYSLIDTGLFLIRKRVFELINELYSLEKITFSQVVMTVAANGGIVKAINVKNDLWTELDTAEDYTSLYNSKKRELLAMILRR